MPLRSIRNFEIIFEGERSLPLSRSVPETSEGVLRSPHDFSYICPPAEIVYRPPDAKPADSNTKSTSTFDMEVHNQRAPSHGTFKVEYAYPHTRFEEGLKLKFLSPVRSNLASGPREKIDVHHFERSGAMAEYTTPELERLLTKQVGLVAAQKYLGPQVSSSSGQQPAASSFQAAMGVNVKSERNINNAAVSSMAILDQMVEANAPFTSTFHDEWERRQLIRRYIASRESKQSHQLPYARFKTRRPATTKLNNIIASFTTTPPIYVMDDNHVSTSLEDVEFHDSIQDVVSLVSSTKKPKVGRVPKIQKVEGTFSSSDAPANEHDTALPSKENTKQSPGIRRNVSPSSPERYHYSDVVTSRKWIA